jgi:hypothetical protein
LNISELNLEDEEDQASDTPEITVEQAMQQFTYHMVPKKTEGLIKAENALMGIK